MIGTRTYVQYGKQRNTTFFYKVQKDKKLITKASQLCRLTLQRDHLRDTLMKYIE
jgi:hypothetical protein